MKSSRRTESKHDTMWRVVRDKEKESRHMPPLTPSTYMGGLIPEMEDKMGTELFEICHRLGCGRTCCPTQQNAGGFSLLSFTSNSDDYDLKCTRLASI
jgi:hypothetical protein